MAKSAGLGVAITKSVLLHGVVGALLFASMEFVPSKDMVIELGAEEIDIIEAVAVDQEQVQQQVQRIQQERDAARRAEEQRVADLERRAREAEQRSQREQQEQRRQEQERRRREAEARAEQERLERERQEAERRLEEQRAEERRIEAERQRREEERRREEEAARQRAEQEQQIQERMERERQERERARQQRVLSEVERYQVLIRQTIQRNWLTDPSMRGRACQLRISIARDGFVTNVQVIDGDRAVCESARAAVLRAGSLPVSSDPDVYREMSNITLRVEPNL
ncbi:MAG: cell envelope integrity protein TolA [Idiomarina sp.]|nr:cell envelope integrity protein TolA [Idiomarina sp.]